MTNLKPSADSLLFPSDSFLGPDGPMHPLDGIYGALGHAGLTPWSPTTDLMAILTPVEMDTLIELMDCCPWDHS